MSSLCIHIQKATNLRSVDSSGYSDPYCEIEIYTKKKKTVFKTKPIKKCLNPVWEEKFYIQNFTVNKYILTFRKKMLKKQL